MRIRVEGTPDAVHAAIARIATAVTVLETSRFHPNRGDSQLGRVYLTAADPPRAPAQSGARAEQTGPTRHRLPHSEHHTGLTADNEQGPA